MREMIVYHGSYMTVALPLLEKCEDGKDFGKGFYVTTSKKQAERFCKTAVGKALKNGKIKEKQDIGYVSRYKFSINKNLSIFEFDATDELWLKCVAGHRKSSLFDNEIEKWESYDIIIGKIANDNTNRVITNYINGDYGNPDDDSAIKIAISLLKPEKLSDQECLRTDKALRSLSFIDSYEVKIK